MDQFHPWTWEFFKNHIISCSRYQLPGHLENYLKQIGEESVKRRIILKKSETFFRARIGPVPKVYKSELKDFQPATPYKNGEIHVPPFEKRKAGRANAKGIGFLYLAKDAPTAIAEVRPWRGAHVSVVEYELKEDLAIVDLTSKNKEEVPDLMILYFLKEVTPQLFWDSLWNHIGTIFSEPTIPDDADIGYVPTQFLAELFSKHGANGIVYKSAMSDSGGFNLVLFEERHAQQIPNSAKLKEITVVHYESVDFVDPMVKMLERIQE